MADTPKKVTKTPVHIAQKHLNTVESKLADQSKNMPQLSGKSRSSLLKILPWFSAFFALLSFVWAKDLWDLIRVINTVNDSLGNLGGLEPFVGNVTELWVVLMGYVLIVVLTVVAFASGITKALKKGWNFLFYAYSSAVITGVLYFVLLSEYSSSRAFMTLTIGLVGLYVLFQLRDHHK